MARFRGSRTRVQPSPAPPPCRPSFCPAGAPRRRMALYLARDFRAAAHAPGRSSSTRPRADRRRGGDGTGRAVHWPAPRSARRTSGSDSRRAAPALGISREQTAAILGGSLAGPSLEAAREGARLREVEEVRDLGDADARLADVPEGDLAPHLIQQRRVARWSVRCGSWTAAALDAREGIRVASWRAIVAETVATRSPSFGMVRRRPSA